MTVPWKDGVPVTDPPFDRDALYEAHVEFELSRLREQAAEPVMREEIRALFAWLAEARLDAVADAAAVSEAALRMVRGPDGPRVVPVVTESLVAGQAAVRGSSATVGDLVSRDDAVRWAVTLAGMEDARSALLSQITTSRAYSRLVAHVVYQGIKSYLLTENVLAKRIPGATSLVRLGQRGLGAAAPGLEQNVDRQLIAFVDANIADTVRDSRRFIDGMIDPDQVAQMSDEAWSAAAQSPVSAAADALSSDDVRTLVDLVWGQWRELRDSPLVSQVLDHAVRAFFAVQGDRAVADILADLDITEQTVWETIEPLVARVATVALDTGYAEERIRERLWAFYSSYPS